MRTASPRVGDGWRCWWPSGRSSRCPSAVALLPQRLARDRARRPRRGGPAEPRRLGDGRPRALPAEPPLPLGRPARRAHRPRQDHEQAPTRRSSSATRSSPASPRRRSARCADTLASLAVDSAVDGALVGLAGPGDRDARVGRRRWGELRGGRRDAYDARRWRAAAVLVSASCSPRSPGTAATSPWSRTPGSRSPTAMPEVNGPRQGEAAADRVGPDDQRHPPARGQRCRQLPQERHVLHQLVDLAPEHRGRSCASPRRARWSGCSSATGTTTSAWTRLRARSPTRATRPSCSMRGTTPRPAARGRRSASSRCDQAFDDYDTRFSIAGNHDNGDFVTKQADRLGFKTLVGKVLDGPDGMRILGVSDPRSSGLGIWRDARGMSFDEQESRLADLACKHDADGDRIDVLLVHDANSGRRGAGARLRRRGARRPPARAGRTHRGRRHERQGGLDLHERHDGRRGVRTRDRQQAATRRGGHAGDVPRRQGPGCSRSRSTRPESSAWAVHQARPDRPEPAGNWRRWRDLNPREGVTLNPLSRRAP